MLDDNYSQFNEEFYPPKDIIKMNIYRNVRSAINKYGLEGTEDVIKRVYSHNPKIRDCMLKTLYNIWKKNENK